MSDNNNGNGSTTIKKQDDDEDFLLPDLKPLLSSLATFAKAMQLIPDDNDQFEYEYSFPEFQSSFNKTQESLLNLLQNTISELNNNNNSSSNNNNNKNTADEETTLYTDLEDPLLWEQCADICDELIEHIERYLKSDDSDNGLLLQQLSNYSHEQSNNKYQLMISLLRNDIPKPQDVYNMNNIQNIRCVPFVPSIHPNKPHHIKPLDITLQSGHGYYTRYGKLRTSNNNNNNNSSNINNNDNIIIAPTQHCPHIYQYEIENFQYTNEQLQVPSERPNNNIEIIRDGNNLKAEWIDTEEQLHDFVTNTLEKVYEIAIDLEAHSYRSFAGIVCLMQISIRKENNNNIIQNYLIDTLKLHNVLNKHLAYILANPNIIKIMHGADMDIQWLQRDFGLYIVNLFDTGRAARLLQYKSISLAYLLKHYVGITVDKTNQLADWRQRPLPKQLQQYAIQDTHYLLHIYDCLKYDIANNSNNNNNNISIQDVLDISRHVCLIRYCPEPFNPNGYKKLLRTRGRTKKEYNTKQILILKYLWDWRDQTARNYDESIQYVCTNTNIIRIALSCPETITQLHGLFNPNIPPLIMRFSKDIINLVHRAITETTTSTTIEDNNNNNDNNDNDDDAGIDDDDDDDDIVEAELDNDHNENEATTTTGGSVPTAPLSSAFFKPANPEKERRSGMMSPVLGTEALYKQAGWTTPIGDSNVQTKDNDDDDEDVAIATNTTTTTDDDDDDDDEQETGTNKPRNLLSLHSANKDYQSKPTSSTSNRDKSMQMGMNQNDDIQSSFDGMGAARALRASGDDVPLLEEEMKDAKVKAEKIKNETKKGSIPAVLGLVTGKGNKDKEEQYDKSKYAKETDPSKASAVDSTMDEEFQIPRSIREIYMISNRNRRNKKAGSPTPERGVTPTSEKEREELARAEALLKSRGDTVLGYFDSIDGGSPGKRPRTKKSGRESEESVPGGDSSLSAAANAITKADDVKFMKDIGWIQNDTEADEIFNQRYGQRRGESGSGKKGNVGGGGGGGGDFNNNNNTESSSVNNNTSVGVMPPAQQPNNPFFSGAAMQGGPLTQSAFAKPSDQNRSSSSSKKSAKGNKQNRNRQQEKPEKKEGRTHAYRKR